ncbi:MAG TPA: zinc ribbon domain-containing protein [Thermoplasmata archaeon]|nr:zinc ribbon domain-containing protein [Thermoplasmata archaeon]
MASAPPTGPAPGAVALATTCPKCGAAQPAGARFCNVCGSSLAVSPQGSSTGTQGAPMPPGTPPLDLRTKVDDDRGVLKRLQLLVPGFRGYRQAEDLREADSLLRLQVADKIKNARATLENARSALSNAGQYQVLTDMAPLIADLQRLEGSIRHAEQGYTGFSPAVRINPQQQDRLYEYDYGFAQAGDQLAQTIAPFPSVVMGGAGSTTPAAILATARMQVNQLDQAFKARIQAIEGIRVS